MTVLLIDDRKTPLASQHMHMLRDQQFLVELRSDPATLTDEAFEFRPDLIVVTGQEAEGALRYSLLRLQSHSETISKPVFVITEQALSPALLHEFYLQIKAVFVKPFPIDAFVTTLYQFFDRCDR